MPRIDTRILAAAVAVAALAVLYVIGSSPVHLAIPPALSSLEADPAPKALPAVVFLDAQGRQRTLAAFEGHVVVLNLWATWCVPCARELPALGRLAAALEGDAVTILAVNVGHDDAAATALFLRAHGAGNLAVYRDPDLSLLQVFGAQGLPFSVIVDAGGREIARALGPIRWDDPAAIVYFRSLARQAGPSGAKTISKAKAMLLRRDRRV